MAKSCCTIAIVGCGLGGISAAISIQRAGHRVTVFEQAPVLAEIGAGIQIPCNSARIFQKWNILSALERSATRGSNINLRSYKDGTILSSQNLIPYTEDTYGAPYFVVHRADFLDLLVTKALNLGVTVRVGATVTSFDFETPAVELSNGERFHADAIFGADGLRSRCREALLGHPDPPYDTGEMAYRVTAKVDKIKQNKETASLTAGSDIQCWMGPNAHAVGYPLKKGNMFNIFFSSPNDLSSEVNVVKADMEELRTKLKSWDPRLIQLVNLADSALKWRLQNSHGTETCGQGAAMAVEDGAVLGHLFSKLEHKHEIPDLLRLYESIRKPRTTRIVECSTAMQEIFNLPDGTRQRERDRQLTEEQPCEGYPNRWADPVFQRWLLGYDTEIEVEKAWEKFKACGPEPKTELEGDSAS